jgi:hypothetical protein
LNQCSGVLGVTGVFVGITENLICEQRFAEKDSLFHFISKNQDFESFNQYINHDLLPNPFVLRSNANKF